MKEYKALRIWVKTHKNMKVLAALRGLSVLEMLDRLMKKELKKEQKKK